MIQHLPIHKGDYVYIRFKALLWHSNCLVQHSTVLQKSVELLEKIYLEYETNFPLVVSFKGIVDSERSFENFFGEVVNKSKRPIIFIHVESFSDQLIDAILRLDVAKRPRFETDSENILKVYCTTDQTSVIKGLIKKVAKAENDFLVAEIKSCSKKVNHRLNSTILSTNVEFDAAKIISEPQVFIWVCPFIADRLNDLIKENFEVAGDNFNPNAPPIKLLSVSLRGSPFASAVSYLINKGYDTIDHLGPKHKLFDVELFENFKKGVQYIYVGDFMVGGTEVKIAKAYSELLGCELNHAVVLSSLLEPDVFKDIVNLCPLTMIREIIHDAEYKLIEVEKNHD